MESEAHRILIMGATADTRESLDRLLRSQGLRIGLATDTGDARAALDREEPVDLILLDAASPDGAEPGFCGWLAARGGPPVILLAEPTATLDQIAAFGSGVSDFVTRPPDPRELLIRIRMVLRRFAERPDHGMRRRYFGDMLHDPLVRRILRADGRQIILTGGENRLLYALIDHAGRVVGRAQLMPLVTGRKARAVDRAVDNAVSRLRRKIEPDPTLPNLIITERSGGYRLVAEVREAEG